MAGFSFRLETVLKQRMTIEDQRQRDLAQVMRERMILEGQLRQMQQTISESRQQLADGLVGRVDLGGVSNFARYSAQARLRAQAIVARLAGIEKRVAAARQLLVEAMRDRKAMEILRDREYARWRRSEAQREAAELDEVGTQGYLRQVAYER